MKKVFFVISLMLFWTILFSSECRASHVFGAEIAYSYVSGSTYLVKLSGYRDCNSLPLSTFSLSVRGVSSGSTSLGGSICCAKDITPRASSSCDRCSNTSCTYGFGIEQYTESAKVDLRLFSGCEFWFFGSQCCDQRSNNVYIECYLNRCHGDQGGPAYEYEPITVICANSIISRYQSAGPGNNGDLMNYRFTEPLSAPGTPISFSAPYTYKSPINYSGTDPDASFSAPLGLGFHYGAQTGLLQFKATKADISYFALVAEEYKKDSTGKYYLVGTTNRRAIINVIDCPANHNPWILGINGGNSDSIYLCANLPAVISYQGYDIDPRDSVKLVVENGTPGTITSYPAKFPKGILAWTPTNKDVNKNPYFLTLTGTDQAKPLPGFVQRRFSIFVKDSAPVTGIKVIDSGCGRYHFSITKPVDKAYSPTYQWYFDTAKISANTDFGYTNTLAGKIPVKLVLSTKSGCSQIFTDTIYHDTAYKKLWADTGICKGSNIQLSAAKGKNLVWSPSTGLSDSSISNPVASPQSTTIYTVSGTDANGCTYTDKVKITVSDIKLKLSGNVGICAQKNVEMSLNYIPGAKYFVADKYNLQLDTITTPGLGLFGDYPDSTRTHRITVKYKGCIKKDSITIFVNTGKIDFGPDKTMCGGDSVLLTAPYKNSKTYLWADHFHGDNPLPAYSSWFCWVKAPKNLNTYVSVGLKMVDSAGCTSTGYANFVVKKFNPDVKGNKGLFVGESLTLTASGGQQYQWAGPGLINYTNPSITLKPDSTTTYYVTISDSVSGCTTTRAITVLVAPKHSLTANISSICGGDTVLLKPTGGEVVKWYPAKGYIDTSASKATVSPSKTTSYIARIRFAPLNWYYNDTVTVVVNDCVWPGDASKDRTADYEDVLNIGVGYGTKGPARAAGTTQWKTYDAKDWAQVTGIGINYKHLDCNGDGVIDAGDTSVISANYGKKHNKWKPNTGNSTDPPIYFKFAKDTFYAGESALAYLSAGSLAYPLHDAFGIGYQVTYQAMPMVPGSAKLSPICDYFCTGNELYYLRADYVGNEADAVTVETNGQASLSTAGKFAVLKFGLKDTNAYKYTGIEWIYARVLSATAIGKDGKEIGVYGYDDSAVVIKPKKKTGGGGGGGGIDDENQSAGKVKIYPNPANDQLIIESGDVKLNQVTIYNAIGQVMLSVNHPVASKTLLNLSSLPQGLYFAEMKTEQGRILRKVVVQR